MSDHELYQQLSPDVELYPQYQSTPTYFSHPDALYASPPSLIPQYFTFEEPWRHLTPPTSPPTSFPLAESPWSSVDHNIVPDQFHLDTTPATHDHYNSLSSEESSRCQLEYTPVTTYPVAHITSFLTPDTTNSLQSNRAVNTLDPFSIQQDIFLHDLTSSSSSSSIQQDNLLPDRTSSSSSSTQQDTPLPDCTSSSSSFEPDMLDLIAENSALITAREMLSDGLYNDVLDFISTSNPPERLHEQFQELWTDTIYRQASVQRGGKVLNAVDRYRLRKRKPFPQSIWNGDHSRHLFKESSRSILQDFYDSNPYPTPEEKRELARKSQLSYSQVSNFFKNKRGRQRGSGHVIPAKRKSAQSPEDAKAILEMLQR